MKFEGRAFKFGNDINTDFIISGRYKFAISDMKVLSQYLFEDIIAVFFKELTPKKSIIIAGTNFGMGSSREQAPWVIKEAGISCVIAKSFARIFYRNAFNIGLPLIEADTSAIKEGYKIVVNVDEGKITGDKLKKDIGFLAFDNFRKELIKRHGIIKYLEKHKTFKV